MDFGTWRKAPGRGVLRPLRRGRGAPNLYETGKPWLRGPALPRKITLAPGVRLADDPFVFGRFGRASTHWAARTCPGDFFWVSRGWTGGSPATLAGAVPSRFDGDSSGRKPCNKEHRSGFRYREVVQRGEGFRLYLPGRRRGRVRSLLDDPGKRLQD